MLGRPRKYTTEIQRHLAIKQQKRAYAKRLRLKRSLIRRLSGRYFRLVIPALAGYPNHWTWDTLSITALRAQTVDLLVAHERSRGLKHYLVAVQRHSGSGLPHLDILMVYSKKVQNPLTRYDYLVKHGDLTRYRTVNTAILDYGRKEDPSPLGDLDAARIVMESRVRTELYAMMKAAMLKNPETFNPAQWLFDNNIDQAAMRTSLFKTIRGVREQQVIVCNRRRYNRPGICQITPEFIRQRLTPAQLVKFHSWPGYQKIIDHLNHIPRWGYRRPHKSKNLFIYGPPNTGKTALAIAIEQHTAVYPLGTRGGWFPAFCSHIYKMLVWDQFSLKILPYGDL